MLTHREIIQRAEIMFSLYFRREALNHCSHVTAYYERLAFSH